MWIYAIPLLRLLSSDRPPWLTTLGLNVQRSEFEGMPVVDAAVPRVNVGRDRRGHSTGARSLCSRASFIGSNYAAMARHTGATVIVPIYPLIPQGTAGTVVPAMADLISSQIDQHGAENVSVYGDSAGGNHQRWSPCRNWCVAVTPCRRTWCSFHRRSISTLSNPAIQFIDDPVFSGLVPTLQGFIHQWAGDLDLTDPLVSPLYGSLEGLPPTAVYYGSRGNPRARCTCFPRQDLGDAGRRLHLHPAQRSDTRLGERHAFARDASRSPRHLPTTRHRY